MTTKLIKNAKWILTMDQDRNEFENTSIYIKDGFIEKVGKLDDLPQDADEVIDASSMLIMPGLVNTHHHFYQTLTRAVPAAQDVNLFNWLTTLYPIWAGMTPEHIKVSTKTALAEMALSGCTTASDHLYLFPNGSKLDDEIEAAEQIGLRFHASRGSMSLGQSKGGLPPDSVVDTEEHILKDSQRLIETYHDAQPGSMLQIVLAPCSPFSVTGELMHQSAVLAREYGVHLHTHLAETKDEEVFCLEKFGYRPLAYMESVGWVGPDVWFAHSVHISPEEIRRYAETGCGVAHCPSSNMRLASGIAPIWDYVQEDVRVGIAVDGSASNDSSHLLAEARQALLLGRVRAGLMGASLSGDDAPPLLSARLVLELATLGGARVLGRTDIGSLEPGKCADLIGFDLNNLDYSGALHDPAAAVLFCNPRQVDLNMVHGNLIVSDGELQTLDIEAHVVKHNQAAAELLQGH